MLLCSGYYWNRRQAEYSRSVGFFGIGHCHTLYVYWPVVADDQVFDWDDANSTHVARHNVMPKEIEQVFANDPMDLGLQTVDGEERYVSVGAHRWIPRVGCGVDDAWA